MLRGPLVSLSTIRRRAELEATRTPMAHQGTIIPRATSMKLVYILSEENRLSAGLE